MVEHRKKSILVLSGLIPVLYARVLVTAFAAAQSQNSAKRVGFTGRLHATGDNNNNNNNFSSELPLDLPRRDDVLAALTAVRRACQVTATLQPEVDENDREGTIGTVEKRDLSPVTVADFAVQGLILHFLKDQFPDDGFIAEEDSKSLQTDDHLCQQVAAAAFLSRKELLPAIDLGKSYQQWQNKQRPSRVWVLDPIDGTRGFLRGKLSGGQYAIALALIEDGTPVIGILGCPNLPVAVDDENYAWRKDETASSNQDTRGCIFVASRGGGCYQLPLEPNSSNVTARRLHATQESARFTKDARFCIGVERYSDALGQCAGMAKHMHGKDRALNNAGEIIQARRMDSQAKHGVIARGGAELYVRLPKPGYIEWIWDHAAGNVVIEEAGGTMTDVTGRPIDFSLGGQLSPDVRGVLMSAGGAFHKALVEAFAVVDGPQNQ
jgi:3'(2'), 5'-bisphosphate nucleotidase